MNERVSKMSLEKLKAAYTEREAVVTELNGEDITEERTAELEAKLSELDEFIPAAIEAEEKAQAAAANRSRYEAVLAGAASDVEGQEVDGEAPNSLRALVAGKSAEARVITLPNIVSNTDAAVADKLRGVGDDGFLSNFSISQAKEDIYTKTVLKFGSVAFTDVAEAAAITDQTPATSTVALSVIKSALRTDISYETAKNLPLAEQELRKEITKQVNAKLRTNIKTEVETNGSSAVNAASNSAVTLGELLDLIYGADSEYVDQMTLFINSAVLGDVHKTEASNFFYDPQGKFLRLAGRPVVVAPFDGFGADNVVASFIHPDALEVAASNIRVEKSADAAFDNDNIRYKAVLYNGTKVHDNTYVRNLVLPS